MNALNKVLLTGNLGINPQVISFEGGKKLAKFSIAAHRSYKNDKGEKISNTQWHNLIAWGNTADYIEKNLKKGMHVAVEGQLLNRNYTDKNGVVRYVNEIQINDVKILTAKKKEGQTH